MLNDYDAKLKIIEEKRQQVTKGNMKSTDHLNATGHLSLTKMKAATNLYTEARKAQ